MPDFGCFKFLLSFCGSFDRHTQILLRYFFSMFLDHSGCSNHSYSKCFYFDFVSQLSDTRAQKIQAAISITQLLTIYEMFWVLSFLSPICETRAWKIQALWFSLIAIHSSISFPWAEISNTQWIFFGCYVFLSQSAYLELQSSKLWFSLICNS